jgi:hypothetical protein
MSFAEFKGPESLVAAAEQALTWKYSAVIVCGGIKRACEFRKELVKSPLDPITILRESLPISDLDNTVRAWAHRSNRPTPVLDVTLSKSKRTVPHIDLRKYQPFSISIGTQSVARFSTQLLDEQIRHSIDPSIIKGFNESLPIDEFEQHPGDIVLIPNGSIHAVEANANRRAQLFAYAILGSASTG